MTDPDLVQLICAFRLLDEDVELSISTRESEIFRNTLSCYHPNDKGESCGKCGACNDRILAFKTLEIEDSIKYE